MEFQPGAVSLNDVIGGELSLGVVPLDRCIRDEESGKNAALINCGAGTNIVVTLDTVDAEVGDRILLFGCGVYSRAAEPGASGAEWQIRATGGTGVVKFVHDEASGVEDFNRVEGGDEWDWMGVTIAICTTAGTIEFRLDVSVGVAGGTVPAGEGQFRAIVTVAD